MKKNKLIIIVGIVIFVIVVGTIFFIVLKKHNNTINEDVLSNGIPNTGLEVTGKLKDYIASLGDNYYIKYSGKFENDSGKLVQAIVEYTKSGHDFALRSSELDMHLVSNENNISSISSKYQLVIKMPKEHVNVNEYNFVSDLGQDFAYEYKEKINNTEYDVEEYMYNGKILKYYFSGSDIKLIKYGTQEIKIIRVENVSNKELLTIPSTYKLMDNTFESK